MRTARQIGHDAKELWRFCRVKGSLDETRARIVADGLASSRRPGALRVLRTFLRLATLDARRRSARIETATPLTSTTRAALERDVARRHAGPLTVTFAVDPSLIGGMRVTIGSDVYDGSVKGGLATLAARF